MLLDSDDPKARKDAPQQIVAGIQHLSDTLERRATQLAAQPEASEDDATRRVLLIDENPAWQRQVKKMLPADFELLQADSADEALELAGAPELEFAMLSWRATSFSGPETLAELKIAHPDLKLMVIADATDEMYEGVAEALGADAFLMRPLNSRQLLAAADDLMNPGGAAAQDQGPATRTGSAGRS
jgi:DNA-binding response OmpR family regulator